MRIADIDLSNAEERRQLSLILAALEKPLEVHALVVKPVERNEAKQANTQKSWPKIPGKGLETVQQIVEHLGLATKAEVAARTDMSKMTVENYMSTLTRKKVLDKTSEFPPKYFIRANGNPNIDSMLPKGTKHSQLGAIHR
jgi:hypothetical protein